MQVNLNQTRTATWLIWMLCSTISKIIWRPTRPIPSRHAVWQLTFLLQLLIYRTEDNVFGLRVLTADTRILSFCFSSDETPHASQCVINPAKGQIAPVDSMELNFFEDIFADTATATAQCGNHRRVPVLQFVRPRRDAKRV